MNKILEKILAFYSKPSQVDPAQKAISNNNLPVERKRRKVGIKPSALYYLRCLYCKDIKPIIEFNTKRSHTRCTECYRHYMKIVMRSRNAAKKNANFVKCDNPSCSNKAEKGFNHCSSSCYDMDHGVMDNY